MWCRCVQATWAVFVQVLGYTCPSSSHKQQSVFSARGLGCEVSASTGEESYGEERWARRAGKIVQGVDFVISMSETCYSGMTVIIRRQRANF